MKDKHKVLLKSILLSSLAMIGTTPVSMQAAVASSISKKEEREAGIADLSETLNSGVLSSSTGYDDTRAHSSHSSHGSHSSHSSSSHSSHSSHSSSSHTSHTSHSSSSHTSHLSSAGGGIVFEGGDYTDYEDWSGSNDGAKVVAAFVLGAAATAGLVYIIKAIKKAHDRNVGYKKANASYNHTKYSPTKYGSRKITAGTIGNDVDEMIDSLIANGAINPNDLVRTPSYQHYKYSRAVKRGVKEMYRRMGQSPKRYATKDFLQKLKTWRIDRSIWEMEIGSTQIPLDSINTLKALAAVLAEKNYLKEYNSERILFDDEKKRILKAYHEFQKEYYIKESNTISLYELGLLYKSSSDR